MAAAALLFCLCGGATAQPADEILLQMQQAFAKGDSATLKQLLPQAAGHALEPWAAYWELRARLHSASSAEVQAFFRRWVGTYQEDRLRNDWLLLLGQRRDWAQFAHIYPAFRMRDDRSLQCYALLLDKTAPRSRIAAQVGDLWLRGTWDAGCAWAAGQLHASGHLAAPLIWRKAREAAEANRQSSAHVATALAAPQYAVQIRSIFASPAKYLAAQRRAPGKAAADMVLLALIRLAAREGPQKAAIQLESFWAQRLNDEQRNWAWAAIGKQAALRLQDRALDYFAKAKKDSDLSDDLLQWRARAALRAKNWPLVRRSIAAMSKEAQESSAWTYWQARALLTARPPDAAQRAQAQKKAQQLLQHLAARANAREDFYGQLALHATGQRIRPPGAPEPPTAQEMASARANPGLLRGLYAIHIGLRSEGVREWNYTTNLHHSGGMPDRALLAAAALACQHQVLDRCINTSSRTRAFADWQQRYPMPYRQALTARTRAIGLDAAYVYGLIRQESRFIMDARSSAGASGLMQLMPATARWTAKKIGLPDFTPEKVNERDINITLGTAYLKLALDDLDGSLALAAAAYNAGPRRAHNWRSGPLLEAAIWIECIPFNETRDYVKKVLANTTAYAALISGQPQALPDRLGPIGPKTAGARPPLADLP